MSTLVAVLIMAALFVLYGAITLVRGSDGAPRCAGGAGACGRCDGHECLEEQSHGSS